ncbi:MAG: adenylosuccinate lyase [Bacteroidales bacterium]|nr:adenylosuccinate lyase [Bacteroidales bacterium]
MHHLSISPVDGRYYSLTKDLSSYFSEFALTKYRIQIEIEYFINLKKTIPQHISLKDEDEHQLRSLLDKFDQKEFENIKIIEKTTNHDVKAVEIYLRQKFDELGLTSVKEWIHFGLTSQDVNSVAFTLMVKNAFEQIMLPIMRELIELLTSQAHSWLNICMLSRTHGQPASPTTLGKEWMVFAERLQNILTQLDQHLFTTKFGGAVGNFNAHYAAFPEIDWVLWANSFLERTFSLKRQQWTTQIEHYDTLCLFLKKMASWNTVLIDLNKDIWLYIMQDYFLLKKVDEEVGSSTMPHKINPIDFENSEGNLYVANALFSLLAEKLPVSRLQRDLTDSTVIRNIGVPFAHSLIAYKALLRGLKKLEVNQDRIKEDLTVHWEVITEAIQTILRREGFPNAYDTLKQLARGNRQLDQQSIHRWIDTLPVSNEVKEELKNITPFNYIGFLKKYGS